jgi:two-component system, OmpR family, KDP operon response regulator KdpE
MPSLAEIILVVDDEPQIRRFLRTSLAAHGYEVLEAASGEEALRRATGNRPDLIVLDLGLPDIDGFEVLEKIRQTSVAPVFILSVRARESEKVRAFELGADDYVTKPFGMAEFVARVKGALRRRTPARTSLSVFSAGNLEVDFEHRIVRRDGQDLHLSPKQYRLLQILATHAGKVVTHQQLLREIWGAAHTEDVQYLRVFMRKLRNKIETDPARPRYLLTELGVGYRLRNAEQLADRP